MAEPSQVGPNAEAANESAPQQRAGRFSCAREIKPTGRPRAPPFNKQPQAIQSERAPLSRPSSGQLHGQALAGLR